MFDFLAKFWGKQKSGEVAKERLQLVLIHDRNDIAPEVLENIKVEIIAALKKYLEIDENEIDMRLDRQNRSVALVANIPLKHIKRGREQEPSQVEKTAVAQKAPVSAKTASGTKAASGAKTASGVKTVSGVKPAPADVKEAAGHAPKSKTPRGQKKKNA